MSCKISFETEEKVVLETELPSVPRAGEQVVIDQKLYDVLKVRTVILPSMIKEFASFETPTSAEYQVFISQEFTGASYEGRISWREEPLKIPEQGKIYE